ncbi:MAG: T9SS type A sorting domain-containing protein [Bacteroidota bacterium]
MKKIILFIFLPLLSIGQTQIGADIDGEAAHDYNGYSVSLSIDGSIIAIGAPFNDKNGIDSGTVRVYKNILGTWTQVGSDIEGEEAGVVSGWSVSLSSDGSILAIGAYRNNGNSGSVRVYKNVSETWVQIGSDIDGEAAGDISGVSISLSSDGSILAIGAPQNDGNGTNSGSVRVYRNVSETWIQIGSDIDGKAAGDFIGNSVSLSGDGSILAIGAPFIDSGLVRVYKNVSDIWTQVGSDIDGKAAGDENGYGISLSTDGSTLAIGAYKNDGNGSNSGSVRVYKNVSGNWIKIGSDIDGEAADNWSGFSVSLSNDGSVLAIGAPYNNGNGAISGSVRVYKNVSGTWIKVGIDIDGEDGGDYSGISVSLSGDGSILAIGAHKNAGNEQSLGSVRVYDLFAVLSSDSFVLAHFSVYPNPASELVTISLEEGLTLEKVNVYNTLGQLVKTENKDVVAVNSLAKGSYYFEVITNIGKATKQIIVQ